MDNMRNNNDDINAKSNNKNRMAVLVSFIALLAICFCVSYFVTDYFSNIDKEIKEDMEEEGKTVAGKSSKFIADSAIVTLKTGEKVDSEQTVAYLKNQNNITSDITKDELSELLNKSGYELIEITESRLLFERPKDYKITSGVQPNKYFIGEKDGYLAIYESDGSGKLSIVSDADVFRGRKKVSDLPKIDQEKIKSFGCVYDSREKAVEDITEFIS